MNVATVVGSLLMIFKLALLLVILFIIAKYIRCMFRQPGSTIAVSFVLIASCFLFYKAIERKHRLSAVPSELGVKTIIYGEEIIGGFGPGGNETGLIVYKLPDVAADKLSKDGVSYLNGFSYTGKPAYSHGTYYKWEETPISSRWNWPVQLEQSFERTKPPLISDYLGTYGFSIYVDPEIERTIDNTISIPGSYFSFGRTGVIIISPKEKIVIYAYAG
jgi:hypothetical protein